MGDAELKPPRSLTELFLVFTRLALQGFGGVLAIAQLELVERERWLTREEFLEMLSVAQVLPGPNVVNLSLMLGDRYFGTRGAFVALAGMLTAPLVLVLGLAAVYARFADNPHVSGALRGMGAVAAGLLLAAAWRLATGLRRHPLGWPLCLAIGVATVAMVVGLRWPLAAVVLGLGTVSVALVRRRLSP